MSIMLNFPQELQNYDQWFLANDIKAPCLYDKGELIPVSPANECAYTFYEALHLQEQLGCDIGFYLTSKDPFCCVDMDVKTSSNCDKPELYTKPEDLQRFTRIVSYLDSYCEKSRSGLGVHVWVKANIGTGCRRDGVEVYSQERFIICTGNSINSKEVANRQSEIEQLVSEMQASKSDSLQKIELVELEPTMSDFEVYSLATRAENADKFNTLWAGNWQQLQYPSQSEADLSLLSMIAFYSHSNEQCRRLFRTSALGQREKTTKNNYHVDRLLRIIRSRQDLENKERLATAEMAKTLIDNINKASEVAEPIAKIEKSTVVDTPYNPDGLEWPPGTAGLLAKFIYSNSMRPVKEISIATALGILAGMCGKAWNITKSGLNMYIVVVGRSGVGKETLHNGTSTVAEKLKETIVGAEKFFNFSSYVSGPALTKAVVVNPCFININGEFGKQLKRLAQDTVNSPMQQLRTAMTHLYQKSDANSSVGGLEYSNKENNVNSTKGVAYSMIGETTPETFYESLTRDMMEDGFLSRFTVIEYDGARPHSNKQLVLEMSDDLLIRLQSICNQAVKNIATRVVTMVSYSAEAKLFLDNFDIECDNAINNNTDEGIRQIWNRAHLKCCRLSALLAVADNWLEPVVNTNHVKWAHQLILKDMNNMFNRVQSGDVGTDDDARIKKMVAFIKSYGKGTCSKTYISRPDLRSKGIITKSDMQRKLLNISSFRGHRLGASYALDKTITSLTDIGLIAPTGAEVQNEFSSFRGKGYYILPELYSYMSNTIHSEG